MSLPSRPFRPARPGERRPRTHLGGFSLPELLVVLSIPALLAAFLSPCLSRARALARVRSCQSNLHQIALAGSVYSEDYDGLLPDARNRWSLPPGTPTPEVEAFERRERSHPKSLHHLLRPYCPAPSTFRCPSDTDMELPQDVTRPRTLTSVYERFGTSYRQVSAGDFVDSIVTEDHAKVPYTADASGYWHPGAPGDRLSVGRIRTSRWRVNVAYLDGHARSVGFGEMYASPFTEFMKDEY